MKFGTRLRPLIITVAGLTILACAPAKSASAVIFPRIDVASPASGASLEGSTSVIGTTNAGTFPVRMVRVGVDGANFAQASGTSRWSSVLNTASYPDGGHSITVRATDYAGNTSVSSVQVSFANAPGSSPLPGATTTQTASTPAPATQPAAAASSAPAFAFGVNYHGMWDNYGDTQRISVLDKMAQAGAKWIRMDVGWRATEPSGNGGYNTTRIQLMDKLVDAARARGLNVLVMVAETPSWANGNKAKNIPPLDMAYFGSYAKAMAYHFAGRVQAWEVWNEPNATWSWNGTVSQYVMMLQSGYRGFKAGDPKALVVLGGISGNNATWLKSAYSAGARGSFDVVATHPYPSPSDSPPEADPSGTPASIPSVRNIEAVLSAHSDSSIPIWFTEFGWSAHANTGSEPATQRGVTPQQQADYLVRALQLIRANYPYVTNAFWYNERDTSTGNVHEDNFGLLQSDLTPTPAYFAAQSYLTTP